MPNYYLIYPDHVSHHGIKGQKWGIRNYQYKDGSLTPEGLKRYGINGAGILSTADYAINANRSRKK